MESCMFLCFHVKIYMKAQKHACFHVLSPLSATLHHNGKLRVYWVCEVHILQTLHQNEVI